MKPFNSTIIIFDTEFIMTEPNKLDLLEIGAIALHKKDFSILDKFFIKCKPERYKYSKRFGKLTKMDHDYFYSGVSHKDAMIKFFRWALKFQKPIFCSWSNYDHIILKQRIYNMDNIVKELNNSNSKINVFDLQRSYMYLFNLENQPSLTKILETNNLSFEDSNIKRHNALSDCFYTLQVFYLHTDHFISDIRNKTKNAFDVININDSK